MFSKVFTLTLAFSLLFAALVLAEDQFIFPETRPGEIAKGYIETFNSRDIETLKKFNVDYWAEASLAKRSADERAAQALKLYEQMGRLVPALITNEGECSIAITVRAEKINMWLSCVFQLEEGEPHKLVSVTIQPGSPPEMATSDDKEWTTLSELLGQVITDTGIPAIAAAVVEDGSIVEAVALGKRQVGTDDEVQIDDRFHIGSITKSITATMIGRLVEESRLDWDITIAEVFSGMDVRAEYRNVTLMQLLRHRSGLPGYLTFTDSTAARLLSLPGSPTEQRAAFVAEVLQSEPVAKAGEEMNYSNAGYVVAGLMAERASGKTWTELIDHYVLTPAGMKNTGFGWPATETRSDQPRGHYYEESGFRAQGIDEYPFGDFIAPAGNINASIGDLALYAKMHLHGLAGHDGIVKAATIKQLHSPPESKTEGTGYAGGWMIVEKEGLGTVHKHSGSAGTFFATVELYTDEKRAIVVAMNAGAGAGAAERIIHAINERRKAGAR
ncbi:MAG: beta-lactamase family protein [bacterium]|nr:MAG: beta-lactamase family protein [bacterium]